VNVLESAALKEANAIVEEIIGSPSNLQNLHITPGSAKSGKYITFLPKWKILFLKRTCHNR
jgi:hypothetical protein